MFLLIYPLCSNGCRRRTDNEYGTCRVCVKKLCIPLDGMRQIEGNFYGDNS